jgi:hypothetical protein
VVVLRNGLLVTLAWIRQAMGDPEGALEAMTEACGMYPGAGAASLFNPAPSERARLLLVQGRIAEAERWTEERGLTEEDALSYPHERDHLVLARVLLARSEVIGPRLLDAWRPRRPRPEGTYPDTDARSPHRSDRDHHGHSPPAEALSMVHGGTRASSPTRGRRWPLFSRASSGLGRAAVAWRSRLRSVNT